MSIDCTSQFRQSESRHGAARAITTRRPRPALAASERLAINRSLSDQNAPGCRFTGRSAAVAVTILAWRARDSTEIENRKISAPTTQ